MFIEKLSNFDISSFIYENYFVPNVQTLDNIKNELDEKLQSNEPLNILEKRKIEYQQMFAEDAIVCWNPSAIMNYVVTPYQITFNINNKNKIVITDFSFTSSTIKKDNLDQSKKWFNFMHKHFGNKYIQEYKALRDKEKENINKKFDLETNTFLS